MLSTVTWTLTDLQAAYLAALIDGEGCIVGKRFMQKTGATPTYEVGLEFGMATEEPLRTIGTWLGKEPTQYPPDARNPSGRWRLRLSKTVSLAVLERCLPHFILKRDQAEMALAIEAVRSENTPRKGRGYTMPQDAVDQMDALYLQLREAKRVPCFQQ